MEVLKILILGGLLLFMIGFIFAIGATVLFVAYMIWPVLLGIGVGAVLWWNGNDNAGVLIAVAFFVGQYFWAQHIDSGPGYNPMSGKKAHYNKDGELTGYSD